MVVHAQVVHDIGRVDGNRPPQSFDRLSLAQNTMEDESLQREIIALFISQIVAVRARLEQGPLKPDEARFMGHTLLGAAAAVGAEEISTLALDWNRLALDHQALRLAFAKAASRFMEQVERF